MFCVHFSFSSSLCLIHVSSCPICNLLAYRSFVLQLVAVRQRSWLLRALSDFRLHCEVDGNCAVLGYYAASNDSFLPTFRDNLLVPYSEFRNPKENYFLFFNPEDGADFLYSWTLKMEPIGCPETSDLNYHYSPRNNPEERSSQVPCISETEGTSPYLHNFVAGHIVCANSVQFTFSEQFICIPFRVCVVYWSTPKSTTWSFLLSFVIENDLPISYSLCMLRGTLIVSSLLKSL